MPTSTKTTKVRASNYELALFTAEDKHKGWTAIAVEKIPANKIVNKKGLNYKVKMSKDVK